MAGEEVLGQELRRLGAGLVSPDLSPLLLDRSTSPAGSLTPPQTEHASLLLLLQFINLSLLYLCFEY